MVVGKSEATRAAWAPSEPKRTASLSCSVAVSRPDAVTKNFNSRSQLSKGILAAPDDSMKVGLKNWIRR